MWSDLDDDLVDVIFVLIVLAIGVAGGLFLMFKYVPRFRRLLCCVREDKIQLQQSSKRHTIRVARTPTTPTTASTRTPATPHSVESQSVAKHIVYIVPKPPSYKTELVHTMSSAQNSTENSHLPAYSLRRGSA